ncbi:uncharacterized protein PpBr36_10833 [Pyricularia pennisetigena]|uniref:uncharacterized protein n=1 Tax=Pyricularia pennisetigena TaxID=1578925 RepID=UPI001154C1DD|nr:uncharacterized protein PpBr36_10833 [Pyricularia pennisetigena]TLS20880.1 hypothetical protein PpBr36_10833 [Pyricularia pennisetigena]
MDDVDISDVIRTKDQLVQDLLPPIADHGVLIPLKTTLEIRDDHVYGQALITRAPLKATSSVVKYAMLHNVLPEDVVKGMSHLRRCSKPCDLPVHLKSQFMNEMVQTRQMHTGKAPYVYIMIGLESLFELEDVFDRLSKIEGMDEEDVFMASIPVPLLPPTSQVQAALWCNHFWPTVYRKNNPLGPHPSIVARATDEVSSDAAIWMALAHKVASKTLAAGFGIAVGACIVQRLETGETKLVALAGDARWSHQPGGQETGCCTGNPMAHAVLRAISMVARKLVRAENRQGPSLSNAPLSVDFDPFQDEPMLDEERRVFDDDHPSPEGYLCHGLELYLTHEPCVMCSMSILHSRMGKVILAQRMPLTGGICSEDRILDESMYPGLTDRLGGGHGLGLFWRRELNWSLLGWEWEPPSPELEPETLSPEIHA